MRVIKCLLYDLVICLTQAPVPLDLIQEYWLVGQIYKDINSSTPKLNLFGFCESHEGVELLDQRLVISLKMSRITLKNSYAPD